MSSLHSLSALTAVFLPTIGGGERDSWQEVPVGGYGGSNHSPAWLTQAECKEGMGKNRIDAIAKRTALEDTFAKDCSNPDFDKEKCARLSRQIERLDTKIPNLVRACVAWEVHPASAYVIEGCRLVVDPDGDMGKIRVCDPSVK